MRVAVLLGVLTACDASPDAESVPAPTSDTTGSALSRAVARDIAAQGLVGAVWATVHDSTLTRVEAAGRRRSDRPDPMRPDDRVQVGSVAKTLVATGVLRLVSEGRLALDAPLDSLLPNLRVRNSWAAERPLRVRHLLDHTAGLDDARLWQLFNSAARPDTPLRDAVEPGRARLAVRHPPGDRMSYSNTGYGILGLVIERVTGQRYEAYLDAHLLRPLGMANSTFAFVTQDGPGADPRLAMGHFEQGALAPAVPTYLRPAMQLTTTAADMARFAQFLMSDGRVDGAVFVRPELLRAMGAPADTEAARAGLPVGYALGLSTRDRHGVVGRCHAGSTVGYRAMLCVYPDQQKAFFISLNADDEDANYARIDSTIIAILGLAPAARVPARATDADASGWEGIYVPSPARFESFAYVDAVLGFTTVTAEDGGVTLDPFQGSAMSLEAVGSGLFRARGRVLPSHVFLHSSDGQMVLSDGFRSFGRVSRWRMVPLWASLAFGAAGLLYILGRCVVSALRRRLPPSHPMFAPFGVVIAVLATLALLTRQSVLDLGSATPVNVALALVTAALPLALGIGLWRALRARRGRVGRVAAIDAIALVAALQWVVVLAAWGLVPLRLWA